LKQLEAQNRLLRDLDQMKSEFVSLVSHELRTPLTSLHGGMELLLSKHNLPKKTRGPLALMQGEVMRLTRFVVNILDVSSVEAGKLHIHMQPVPVGVLVGRVIQELSVQPGAGRIQVLLDRPELRVMADETVLHSILLHLLDNALKYAPEGDVQLLVATGRGRARFQVIDRGPGIPEQKRHLLFRRFQRLDSSDSQAVYGYGLGLYFSRKMVAAMQGKLTYARLPDGGSCFQFGLEAVHETEDPADR
jgi:K+-sensing histidine kinase KdpD